MPKPHELLQTMNKTFARFTKDLNDIVGEVALTKYPLIASEMVKMTKVEKSKKKNNNLKIMSNPHAHLQTMNKTSAKFKKIKLKL